MKLAFVSGNLSSLVNFRGPLLRALQAKNHELVVIAPSDSFAEQELRAMHISFTPAKVGRTGLNPLADIRTIFQFWRSIRATQPDIFFASQVKAVTYGLLAAVLARIPKRAVMIEGLGAAFASAPGVRRKVAKVISLFLYFISLRFAHVIFFLNTEDKDYFERWPFWGKATKVVVLPGIGVDLDHFAPVPMPAGPVTFLMVARLHRDKGGAEFAAAARLVRQHCPEARFQLLGPMEQGLGGVSSGQLELWQKEGIEYLGETRDVRPFLAAAHVVVLPTVYREGVPRSLLEAAAMARPIITTDVPGARETVVAGCNGFLVKPRHLEELVKAMRWCYDHKTELTGLGLASRRLAERKFAVGQVNRQIMEALGVA